MRNGNAKHNTRLLSFGSALPADESRKREVHGGYTEHLIDTSSVQWERLAGAVGLELTAALELLNLLIPRTAENATSRPFAPLRYTPGTRIFFSEHPKNGVHIFGDCFRTQSGGRTKIAIGCSQLDA